MIRAVWVQRASLECSFKKVMQFKNQMGLTLAGPPRHMGIEVCMSYYSLLHPAPCDPLESHIPLRLARHLTLNNLGPAASLSCTNTSLLVQLWVIIASSAHRSKAVRNVTSYSIAKSAVQVFCLHL